MKRGWIKLYRSLLDNPTATKSTGHLAVWIYLLLNASVTSRKIVFKGEEMELKPGQLITGRKEISDICGDLNESKVHRVLKDFENAQQIEQQTTSQKRLISLINWSKYQDGEQQNEQRANNERTTSEQQANNERTLYKNVIMKESKNVKKRENTLTKHGQFQNVLLTQGELDELMEKYPNDWKRKIERLSRYLASTGKHFENHFATLVDWIETDGVTSPKSHSSSSIDYDKLNRLSIPDV